MGVIHPIRIGTMTGRRGISQKGLNRDHTDQDSPAIALARARWISVVEPQRFSTAELQELIRTAYGLIRAKLTKKLQAELGEWPPSKERHK